MEGIDDKTFVKFLTSTRDKYLDDIANLIIDYTLLSDEEQEEHKSDMSVILLMGIMKLDDNVKTAEDIRSRLNNAELAVSYMKLQKQ